MKRLMLVLCFFYFQNGLASQPPQKPLRRNICIIYDPREVDGENGGLKLIFERVLRGTKDVIIAVPAHIYSRAEKDGRAIAERFYVEIQQEGGLILLIPKQLKEESGLNKFTPATESPVDGYKYVRVNEALIQYGNAKNLGSLFAPDLSENKQKYEWYVVIYGHGTYYSKGASIKEGMATIGMAESSDSGRIAGIDVGDFQNFLGALNKVNTKVLYINTCFGGDLNLYLAFSNILYRITDKVVLKPQIKFNYDIIAGAVTGSATYVNTGGPFLLQEFFDLAHQYFGDQKGTKRINDELLIKLCSQMNTWSPKDSPVQMIAQLAQIKFTNQDFFQIVPINDTFFVLNDVVVKKHMLAVSSDQGKPKMVTQQKTLELPDKKYILLYSPEIEIDVKFSAYGMSFVSMIAGPAVHVFNSVNRGPCAAFTGVHAVPNVIPKYYLAKKVLSHETYLNALTHVQADSSGGLTDGPICYYFVPSPNDFKNPYGNHYIELYSELKIEGSEELNTKIQGIIDSIASLARAPLEKRIRELNALFMKLLETLNGAIFNKKNPEYINFLKELTKYSRDREKIDNSSLWFKAFESTPYRPY